MEDSLSTRLVLGILQLPRKFIALVRFVLIVIVFYPFRLVLPRKKLDVKDKKILLIANGPTLEKDLERINLKDYDEICMVNAASNSALFEKLQPSLYFIQDKYWFSQHEQLSPKARDTGISINKKLEWDMTLCFPGRYAEQKVLLGELANEHVNFFPLANDGRFFTFSQLFQQDEVHFSTGFERLLQFLIWDLGLNSIHKTGIASTVIFEHMTGGAQRIDIVGLNMSMANDLSLSEAGSQQFRPSHFYGRNSEYTGHTDLADFGGGTMAGAYLSIATKFATFDLLAEYAKRKKCTVTNLSSRTLLDSFPIQN